MAQLKTKQISDFVSAVEGKINGMVGTSVSDAISTAVSGASSTLSNEIVAVADDLASEVTRATGVEADLSAEIMDARQYTSDEMDARYTADQALSAEIATVASNLASAETDLSAEIATVAGDLASYEASNDTALAAEVTRATGAEANLSAEIVTVAGDLASYELSNDAALSAEVVRAEGAEGRLSAAIVTVSDDLASEVTRATGVEATLRTDVDSVTADVTAILAASQADKDSFAEIVDLINSVDLTNDNALAAAVLTINDNIDAEASARADADTALGVRIDNLNTDLASDISDAVAAETVRAEGVEATLSDAISDEESARITADGTLSDAISNLDRDLSSDIFDVGVAAANYTNDRETAITAAYQSYADQAEFDAISSANQYTDLLSTDVATVTNALDGRIDSLESSANDYMAYADQAELDAIASAGDYTDGEIGTLSTDVATVTNALDGRISTLEGQDIAQQIGTVVAVDQFTVASSVDGNNLGLKVFINGLQIHEAVSGLDGYRLEPDGRTFSLTSLGYDIDVNDHIIVYGVLA